MLRKKKKIYIAALAAAAVFSLALTGCGVGAGMESAVREVHRKLIGDNTLYVDSVSEDKYAYQTLDDEAKAVYDEIVFAFRNRESDVQIATTDLDVMELAYQAVRYDYCEFFWVDQLNYVTYSRADEITAIEITPTFTMSEKEQEKLQQQIDREADRMLAEAPVEGSDFDKALYVYETLINEVDYNEDSENNQNIISVFINHETICQGYAYATQYLLERLGIPCTTVTGIVDSGETHAWNLVILDGDYYYIDTTWGNSQYVYRNEEEAADAGVSLENMSASKYLDYDYFGATTETILTTHQPDVQIELPNCTATADNYYIHQGLYVDTWDVDLIGDMIGDAYKSGKQMLQIKFADMEMCEQAMQYFVEDSHLLDYCEGVELVQYMENTDNGVLVLMFPSNES